MATFKNSSYYELQRPFLKEIEKCEQRFEGFKDMPPPNVLLLHRDYLI